MKRKVISLIMAVSMMCALFPTFSLTASAVDDIEISTLAELEAFRDAVNAGNDYSGVTVTLTADIDLGGIDAEGNGIEGKEWTPIGNGQYKPYSSYFQYIFSGTFDGGGHKISGLYINTSEDYQGLFGYVYKGVIKNIGISGYIEDSGCYCGGIVGYNSGGTVSNCYNNCSITGDDCVGGVVGKNVSDGTVSECYNTGSMKSGYYQIETNVQIYAGSTGGVIGYNAGIVSKCYNTGSVWSGRCAGGVVGQSDGGEIYNCYNTGAVWSANYASGVLGCVDGSSLSWIKYCYNTGEVTGLQTVSGLCGIYDTAVDMSCEHCYYLEGTASGAVNGADTSSSEKKTLEEFAVQSTFANWDFDEIWVMDAMLGRPVLRAISEKAETAFDGYGTEENPYLIPDRETLEKFRDYVNAGNDCEGLYFKVTADIDLEGSEDNQWIPIADCKVSQFGDNYVNFSYRHYFTGTFDGGGHTISGLYINNSNYSTGSYQGLFGHSYGTIKNISVEGSVSGYARVGGIVGYAVGEISNCYNAAVISGDKWVGGVAGEVCGGVTVFEDGLSKSYSGKILSCYNTAAVSGTQYAGGIAGYLRVTYMESPKILNCYNIAVVNGTSSVGGIVGYPGEVIKILNSYYLSGTARHGCGDYYDMIGFTESKTAAEFASGEVAYLLQGGQTADEESGVTPQIWGQNLPYTAVDEETGTAASGDAYPVLTAENALSVHKVSFKTQSDGDTDYAVLYANPKGTVILPTAPTSEVYSFTKWSQTNSADGAEFTANTPVTADMTVYAVGEEKYGENDNIKTVITTYGTEETKDLSSYTVFAAGTSSKDKFTYEIIGGNKDTATSNGNKVAAVISGDTLTIPNDTPADTYTLTIKATEKEPQGISLFAINYGIEPVIFDVKVTVNRAIPSDVTTPTVDASITYGEKLSDVTLPDGWTWSDGETMPTVINSGYIAEYAVDDTNYDWSGIDGYNADTHNVIRTVNTDNKHKYRGAFSRRL